MPILCWSKSTARCSVSEQTGDLRQISRGTALTNRKLATALLLLLSVTWIPVFGTHIYRTSLSSQQTGTVIAIFPPTLDSSRMYDKVISAKGSLVKPITWFHHAWIVESFEPGFVGRLKKRGAWGVFSTDLFRLEAILSCFQRSP